MKKSFYQVSNILLSSLIALLGFGSCKTTKDVSKEKVDANTEASTPHGGITGPITDSLNVVPRPVPPSERVILLYGVRPPKQEKVEELIPKIPEKP